MTYFTNDRVSYHNNFFYYTPIHCPVENLGHELLVGPEIISEQIKQNTLHGYVEKRRNKYGPILNRSKADYTCIRSSYIGLSNLISAENPHEKPSLPLTENFLKKIVTKANHALRFAGKNWVKQFSLKEMPVNIYFICMRHNNQLFIFESALSYSSTKKSHLKNPHIAIQKTYCLSRGCFAEVTVALTETGNKMIQNHVNLLKHIQRVSPYIKLQSVPMIAAECGDYNLTVTELYNGGNLLDFMNNDLLNLYRENTTLLLETILELLQTLRVLHDECKIIHGDIHPKNYRIQINENLKTFQLFLGNFAGSKYVGEEPAIGLDHHFDTAHTPGYYTETDRTSAIELFTLNIRHIWVLSGEKRDIFALASCIWQLLYGVEPYALANGYPDTRAINEPSVPNPPDPEIKEILMRALSENPIKRPAISEIEHVISTVLRNKLGSV